MSPRAWRSAAAGLFERLRGPTEGALDLTDVQGNVLRPYDNDHAELVFVEVDDAASARRLLRELEAEVTPATEWVVPPACTTNLAFTAAGLRALTRQAPPRQPGASPAAATAADPAPPLRWGGPLEVERQRRFGGGPFQEFFPAASAWRVRRTSA